MRQTVLYPAGGAAVLAALGFGFLGYKYSVLSHTLSLTTTKLGEAEGELATTQTAHTTLSEELAEAKEENIRLAGELRREQQKNGVFEDQLEDLSGTVGELEKLAKTDPELLAKYSKIYFLNENYSPPSLSRIPDKYGFEQGRIYEVHTGAAPFLTDLLEEAEEDGLSLRVASSYRSFGTQAALKSGYQVRYGAGANAFSADQGYSEHQLGTAVDFTTPSVGGMFVGFQDSKEYDWLRKNSWRYGFILSYPSGNTYYQYEPWHSRFVGTELAERLHEDDEWFYDLDQRVIDTYLSGIFD